MQLGTVQEWSALCQHIPKLRWRVGSYQPSKRAIAVVQETGEPHLCDLWIPLRPTSFQNIGEQLFFDNFVVIKQPPSSRQLSTQYVFGN
jgi:hypothetical protein